MSQAKHKRTQDALLKKCKNGKCLILKGGYYYRDNYRGYTEHLPYAGVYDAVEAHKHVTSCSYTDFIRIVPIDTGKHNKVITDQIKLLAGHLI